MFPGKLFIIVSAVLAVAVNGSPDGLTDPVRGPAALPMSTAVKPRY